MNSLQDCFQCLSSALREVLFGCNDAEWTLHDALRLNHSRAIHDSNTGPRVNVCIYDSEYDLEDQWQYWDEPRWSPGLNALVMLNQQIHGNLRDVIRRRYPASRLILSPQAGFWPGTDSAVDLALAHSSLGWDAIEVCRDARLALRQAMSLPSKDERLVVFCPAPLETIGLLPIGTAEGVYRRVM